MFIITDKNLPIRFILKLMQLVLNYNLSWMII